MNFILAIGLGTSPVITSSRAKDAQTFNPPARNNFATAETGNASIVAMGKAAYGQLGGGESGNAGLRLEDYST